MIQKIKKLFISLSALALIGAPALVPVAVYAQATSPEISRGLNCGAEFNANNIDSAAPVDCPNGQAGVGDKVNNIIRLVINLFSLLVGVISVIMIIIGGLKYITSGGDSGNVTGAKNTILYAVIGLVVVALAQFVVRFVLSKVTTATGGA